MRFFVTEADETEDFEKYGLKTKYMTWKQRKIILNPEEREEGDSIFCKVSDVELDSLEDLGKFIDSINESIIIHPIDRSAEELFGDLKGKYDYNIVIYNGYYE